MADSPIARRAVADDLEVLAALFDGYRKFYEQPSDLAAAREFLRERMDKDESVVFLAERGGAALGFTQLYPTFSSVSLQRVWILNDMFVVPEARGEGVGSLLLDKAAAFGRETGAKCLNLETAKDNFTAQRLYERHGYEQSADFLHYSLSL